MIAIALCVALAAETPETPETPTTETAPTTELPTPPALTQQQQVEILIGSGRALEATALLLKEERAGTLQDPAAAGVLLARAADALADNGDVKAAAVAADAGWRLSGRTTSPRAALLVARYARVVADVDAAGGRALAERALAIDPDNAEARALLSDVDGFDTWTAGHLTLGGGVALAAVSAAAFVYGFDVERQLRGGVHPTAEIDGLLLQRGVAAGVAWPSAVAAVVASGLGLALIMQHEEAVPSTLPASFPALSAPTGAAK